MSKSRLLFISLGLLFIMIFSGCTIESKKFTNTPLRKQIDTSTQSGSNTSGTQISSAKEPNSTVDATVNSSSTAFKSETTIDNSIVEELTEGNSKTPIVDELFDKDKINIGMKETLVICNCNIKNGPGETYKDIGSINYGETVLLEGNYNGWSLAKSDVKGEFWINTKNVVDYHYSLTEWKFGVVTADKVTIGEITLCKGNLVEILWEDSDRSYVKPDSADISSGYSGWIKNSDYTTDLNGVYFNQAFLKKDAKVYNEASEDSGLVVDLRDFPGDWIDIDKVENDGWMYISVTGGRSGWVRNTDVYIP